MAGLSPARTAYQGSVTLGTSWSVAWRRQFQISYRETVYPAVQPIISAGHVLVPTLQGKLRCFAEGVAGGTLQWTVDVGAPVLATPCADGTNVYLADLWGRLSAFKLSDGTAATGWTNPVQVTTYGLPIRAPLLLADSKLMFGGEDGTLYARSLSNGAAIWSYSLGSPILQGAAWSSASGTNTVVVGAMDGRVLALNSGTGALIAVVGPKAGAGFRDFYPVIVGTQVWLGPLMAQPYWEPGRPSAYQTPNRGIVADIHLSGEQDSVLAAYDASPAGYVKAVYVLSLANLSETANQQVIHFPQHLIHGGAHPAPCLESSGYLVAPLAQPSDRLPSWGTGSHGLAGNGGWGRVNLTTRKYVDDLYDTTGGLSDTDRGYNNRDENVAPSACANGIVVAHHREGGPAITGFWNQATSRWVQFSQGPGTNELDINHMAPCAQPAAIVGGTSNMVYHISRHTLVAWRSS